MRGKRARLIVVAVATGLAVLVAPVLTYELPRWLQREAAIAFLWTVMLAEIAGFVLIPVATVALAIAFVRARWGLRRPWVSRLLLLAVSTLIAHRRRGRQRAGDRGPRHPDPAGELSGRP